MKSGIELIAEERRRQIEEEGYDKEHDKHNSIKTLCHAAAAYVLGDSTLWEWDLSFWKPTSLRRDLVKAGALIAAALDKLNEEAA